MPIPQDPAAPQLPQPAPAIRQIQAQAQLHHPPGEAAYYAPSDFEDDGRGGLLEYWQILRRRKGTVLLIAFLGVLSGVLVTLPQTPVYQARTSLEVQDMNQDFMNMRQMTPVSEGGQGYTALTDIQTQIKILQSETLAERTMAKLKLTQPADLKLPVNRVTAWRRALNLPEPKPVDAHEAMLKSMAKNIKVKAAGQTRIIEVLVDSTDPALAARFANTLANEYIDQNMQARWLMTQRTGDWLGRQLDDMRIKLERSEDALQAYARQSGLMFTSEKQNVSEEKLRQLQLSLSTAQADRVGKQSRFEMATKATADTLPDVLNDSSLRELQSKLTDLRRPGSRTRRHLQAGIPAR